MLLILILGVSCVYPGCCRFALSVLQPRDWRERLDPEMTSYVTSETLNTTHSFIYLITYIWYYRSLYKIQTTQRTLWQQQSQKKGKATPIVLWVLGPQLIVVFRWLVIHLAVRCQYFPSGPWLPSQLQFHCPLAGTKLYCLVTEAHVHKQLALTCYTEVKQPGFKPATTWSSIWHPILPPPTNNRFTAVNQDNPGEPVLSQSRLTGTTTGFLWDGYPSCHSTYSVRGVNLSWRLGGPNSLPFPSFPLPFPYP